MKRTFAVLALAVGLVALPATATAAVKGTYKNGIAGVEQFVDITIENTGSSSIERLEIKLRGARHSGANPDRPGTVDGTYSETDFTFTPSDAIGPGGTVKIRVYTNGPVTGVLVRDDTIESNGFGPDQALTDEDAPPPSEDPPGENPPTGGDPPADQPEAGCRCADFVLFTRKFRMEFVDDAYVLKFALDWDLDCNESPGTGCEGTFDVIGPRDQQGLDFTLRKPRKKVTCKSDGTECKDTTGSKGVALRIGNSKKEKNPQTALLDRLSNDPATGKPATFVLRIQRDCGPVALKDLVLKVVFNKQGLLNKKKSDLDGNGKPDGKAGG